MAKPIPKQKAKAPRVKGLTLKQNTQIALINQVKTLLTGTDTAFNEREAKILYTSDINSIRVVLNELRETI